MSASEDSWDWSQLLRELSESAGSLDSVEPCDDITGLGSLDDSVANATVIGLGEASHGTREFIQFRHRLIRSLVEERGLRLIGLEANFAATLDITEYVVNGVGTAETALSQDAIHGTYRV